MKFTDEAIKLIHVFDYGRTYEWKEFAYETFAQLDDILTEDISEEPVKEEACTQDS